MQVCKVIFWQVSLHTSHLALRGRHVSAYKSKDNNEIARKISAISQIIKIIFVYKIVMNFKAANAPHKIKMVTKTF